MKKAIIVGYKGQDGQYLLKSLRLKGYDVVGIGRRDIEPVSKFSGFVDINNSDHVFRLLHSYTPHEIYYLPAFHHSSQEDQSDDTRILRESFQTHVLSLSFFLEGMEKFSPLSKLFYAASSHIWGDAPTSIQNEDTPINPNCVYGITKAAGLQTCRFFRRNGIFASVGILYNHESPLRPVKFISQKIVYGAVAIKEGRQDRLSVGDLSASVDWGFAGDYVEAMQAVLQLDQADDFIVATGRTYTVRDFIERVFDQLKLDWKKYVVEDQNIIIKKKKYILCGDPSKLMARTNWRPSVTFDRLVDMMVQEAMKKVHV